MSIKISHIVAAATSNEIGADNSLLWHLPNDMKFFKNTTWAMPVIMGRKTYESIAVGPLPGRYNIVITRNASFDAGSSKVWIAKDINEAISLAASTGCKEAFIIGGGEIYQQSLSMTHRIYMTRVHHHFPTAQVHYPGIPDRMKKISQMEFAQDEKHAYPFSIEVWE
ncbi:MAG: dihydrofolate reductase [Chitinophagaceae bacterium]